MFFSKPVQYALRALSYMAKQGEDLPLKAEDLATQEDIPKPFLSKILKRLVEVKILRSTKGPGGGFFLNKKSSKITLYNVVDAFEDVDAMFGDCVIGWKRCSDLKPCALHHDYKQIRTGCKMNMQNTTLEIFLQNPDNNYQ